MNVSMAVVPVAFAAVDWIAVAKNWKRLRYAAKPGVILALLTLLWTITGFRGRMVFFALALLFSMAGDIFLILPNEQFNAALVSFFLAHLNYIAAYNPSIPPPALQPVVILFGLVLVAVLIFNRISNALSRSGNDQTKLPLLIYLLALTGMVFSAIVFPIRNFWTPASAIWTSTGALFFLYSDCVLAWNRFVKPLPHGRLQVIISYHLGQIALINGAILHFQSAGVL
jgi:uncharacterized membrane protein YhhN